MWQTWVFGGFIVFRISGIMHPKEIDEAEGSARDFFVILKMFEKFIRFKRLLQAHFGNKTPREEKHEQEKSDYIFHLSNVEKIRNLLDIYGLNLFKQLRKRPNPPLEGKKYG